MNKFFFDCEGHLIRPALLAPPMVSLQYARDNEDVRVLHANLEQDEVERQITHAIRHDLLIGHNIAFDLALVACRFPHLMEDIFKAYADNRVTDTMIRQRLIDLSQGTLEGFMYLNAKNTKITYDLAFLAFRYANVVLDKSTWRLRYSELDTVPVSEWDPGAKNYAGDDVVWTRVSYAHQEKERHTGSLRDEFRQARAAWMLHLMMCWGMRTDSAKIDEWEAQIRARQTAARGLVLSSGLLRVKGSKETKDTKAAKAAMVRARGLSATLTLTGEQRKCLGDTVDLAFVGKYAALDEEACRDSGDASLEAYAAYTSLTNMLSKDVPAVRQGLTYPIQSRFQTLIATGRTSSSGGINDKGPLYTYQVQNVRREPGLRECFRARDGYVLIARDFSGMELHSWSQCCITLLGHSDMATALNAGVDAHLDFARDFMLDGMPYEEAKSRKKEERVKEARQAAKAGNFGLPGGLGATTFRAFAKGTYGVILDEDGAKKIIKGWKTKWSEAQEWLNYISRMMNRSTRRTTIEQLFVGRIRADCSFPEAANGYFQGLAADAAKAAGFELAREAYTVKSSPMHGCRPWNFVHDEFIYEAPEDQAHEAYIRLGEIMEEQAARFCPDVPPRTEGAMMINWSKAAEEIRDSNGRVIPYERKATA